MFALSIEVGLAKVNDKLVNITSTWIRVPKSNTWNTEFKNTTTIGRIDFVVRNDKNLTIIRNLKEFQGEIVVLPKSFHLPFDDMVNLWTDQNTLKMLHSLDIKPQDALT